MRPIPTAAATISQTPPRRRASATATSTLPTLTSAIVSTNEAGAPTCAAGASSQYSIGPRLYVSLPVTAPANEYCPTSGMCELNTSNERVAMIPRSATGCQPSCSARAGRDHRQRGAQAHRKRQRGAVQQADAGARARSFADCGRAGDEPFHRVKFYPTSTTPRGGRRA